MARFHAANNRAGRNNQRPRELPLPLAEDVICLYHDYVKILRAYDLQVEAFTATSGPGEPDEDKTKNFEVTRTVLLQLMTRGVKASDEVIRALEVEAERSVLPGRRRRLSPSRGEPPEGAAGH